MELLKKKQLLDLVEKNPTSDLFREGIIDYALALGYDGNEYYNSLHFIRNTIDVLYCGNHITEKGKFFLYDENNKDYLWFFTAGDAVEYMQSFATDKVPANSGCFSLERDYKTYFDKYNLARFRGFFWIKKESLEIFDPKEIEKKLRVYCVTYNRIFETESDAIEWLYSTGKIANRGRGLRNLQRCLDGKTQTSYKMEWERI